MFQIFRVNILLLIVLLFGHVNILAGNGFPDAERWAHYYSWTCGEAEYTAQYEIQEAAYELVDEGSVPRRYSDVTKMTCYPGRQQYIDFLHCIFPVVPVRGAPRDDESAPKQLSGYGMLYLQYLF